MIGYKWLPRDAAYAPCSSYPSLGRFGDGTIRTLYVAETDRGAMAEFFRRFPELIEFQDDLEIIVYELDIDVPSECLDVLADDSQGHVGISLDRLTSSEPNEAKRYLECRETAREAVAQRLTGIFYPSAAGRWAHAWNLVLFDEKSPKGWECSRHREVARPRLVAADVSPLPLC